MNAQPGPEDNLLGREKDAASESKWRILKIGATILIVATIFIVVVVVVVFVVVPSLNKQTAPPTPAPTPAPVPPPRPSGVLEFGISECTVSGGCQSQTVAVTIDQNYRWYHDPNNSKTCKCTDDPDQCSQCVLDSPDNETYLKKYDVTVSSDLLSLNLGWTTGGSRLYLLDKTHSSYQALQLLGKEFTFTVDNSKLPCGMNGALYLVEMRADGSGGFGAKFGTGYCDAQCPTFPSTIAGKANTDATPQCCNEFDFWEANRAATVMTTHACQKADGSDVEGVHVCVGDECKAGDASVCDKNGCGLNPYENGHTDFYGNTSNISGVDSRKPFSVTTQFITNGSELSEVRRFYTQDGNKIDFPNTVIGGTIFDSITEAYCDVKGATFADKRGLALMGRSLQRGMVLAMSLWNDEAGGMVWMDGSPPWSKKGHRMGPCGVMDESKDKGLEVVYSNIKFGEIGSTT